MARAMHKYICLLLIQRRRYADQPLTVVLRRRQALEDFNGVEGIEWMQDADEYWLQDEKIDI